MVSILEQYEIESDRPDDTYNLSNDSNQVRSEYNCK